MTAVLQPGAWPGISHIDPMFYTTDIKQNLGKTLNISSCTVPFRPNFICLVNYEATMFLLISIRQCIQGLLIVDMICEPSHFKRLNTQEELQHHVGPCQRTVSEEEIFFPAFEPKTLSCHLQQQPMLFSCVGEHPEYSRLCPCRDFIHGQTALCASCID